MESNVAHVNHTKFMMVKISGKQPLTMNDRSKLHYTNAVLHETMRIRTLVPLSVPRKTTCDTSIGMLNI